MPIAPSATRIAPNHITATVDPFMIRVSTGMVTANRRLTRMAEPNRSRLASSKRSSSRAVRTNARMTRTPESVSRITWLMWSTFFCIAWNSGMARRIVSPMTSAMSGRITSSSSDSALSSRTARKMPPMIIIGADAMTVRPMNTTVWTCWTSLVLRVMSDAGPNLLTSTCEKLSTASKMTARTSRPKPMATCAPQ